MKEASSPHEAPGLRRSMVVKVMIGWAAVLLWFLWMFLIVGPAETKKRDWCRSQRLEARVWDKKLFCYDRPNDRWIEAPDFGAEGGNRSVQ